MTSKLAILAAIIYAIVETLEKFGLSRKYAHLLAIPLGIAGGFVFLRYSSPIDNVIYGIFAGITAVGTCDTLCNVCRKEKEK
ncbi:MAG: hypothetical protein N4A57_18510 [Anaeromicrobium sp.]|jgi:TctA family transporter|uniref:hypothetical protein n=1 Tax=Anaeromicrobium sp. TaxID=1929132 RepID=UPI0025FBFB47|nr:hypothetical protein [Anaeromicrobium sp.]MCT4596243.1 hypothetical protein [Anaeromicrobium sp.]